jgi:hypothetical protein
MEYIMVDSTMLGAHACSAVKKDQKKEGLGRSCGGFSTKIHTVCDALENPLDFAITGGEMADCTQMCDLIKDMDFDAVLADKGYDTDEILQAVENTGSVAIIPPKKIAQFS